MCVIAALTISCAQTCVQQESDRISAQRSLGQRVRDDLHYAIEIVPGLVDPSQSVAGTTTMRASALVAQLDLAVGADIDAPIKLKLRNTHPTTQVRVVSHQPLDDISAYAGLGLTDDRQRCPAANKLAATIDCQELADQQEGLCAAPTMSRDASNNTTIEITLEVPACTGLSLVVEEPATARSQDLSFVVVGRVGEPAVLQTVFSLALNEAPVDFFVFLGDANQDNNDEHLDQLANVAAQAPAPLVMIPGKDEIEDGILPFGQRFGAFDYRWTFGGVQFVTFYSADRELGLRGITALESQLIAMAREDQREAAADSEPVSADQARRWPALAFTHSPIFDPSGLRDHGLVDRNEAARALSMLSRFGVSTLFSGGQVEPSVSGAAPQLRTTSAYRTLLENRAEYLRVTVSNEQLGNGQKVGDKFLIVESRTLPEAL